MSSNSIFDFDDNSRPPLVWCRQATKNLYIGQELIFYFDPKLKGIILIYFFNNI